jgi:hypothetical protein
VPIDLDGRGCLDLISTSETWYDWFDDRPPHTRSYLFAIINIDCDVLTLSAAPIDESAFTPTPNPTPSTGQIEQGYLVYDDKLAEGWTLNPWNGTADFSSVSVYQGSGAIEITLPAGGAILLDNWDFDTSFYDYMVFYLNGSSIADQALYIEMISVDNITLGRAELVDYIEDDPLQPNKWHRVMIPLTILNPNRENFGWFDLGDASGNGASAFFIDEIRFVSAEP